MISPLAAAVAELQADATVRAIVGQDAAGVYRVRPVEPAAGDALGAGHYIPFVVVVTLDEPWQASTATSSVTLGLRCYAAIYPAAEALYLACAAVFHRKGPRIAASRLGIYNSLALGGGTLGKDPDTAQPVAVGVIELNVSIQPIPA
jgi:hypothetical protein